MLDPCDSSSVWISNCAKDNQTLTWLVFDKRFLYKSLALSYSSCSTSKSMYCFHKSSGISNLGWLTASSKTERALSVSPKSKNNNYETYHYLQNNTLKHTFQEASVCQKIIHCGWYFMASLVTKKVWKCLHTSLLKQGAVHKVRQHFFCYFWSLSKKCWRGRNLCTALTAVWFFHLYHFAGVIWADKIWLIQHCSIFQNEVTFLITWVGWAWVHLQEKCVCASSFKSAELFWDLQHFRKNYTTRNYAIPFIWWTNFFLKMYIKVGVSRRVFLL